MRSIGLFAVLLLVACQDKGTSTDQTKPSTAAASGTGASATAAPATTTAKPAAAAAADDPQKVAEEIFTTRCSTCHGATGKGDGPAGGALNPKPRDLQDPAWHASVDDAHIEKIIREGGMAVGKSPLMPPNPDLVDKPAVVTALKDKVRSFKK